MKNDNKEPIALTVNEGMEQGAVSKAVMLDAIHYSDMIIPQREFGEKEKLYYAYLAGYKANNSYGKAIEDAVNVVEKFMTVNDCWQSRYSELIEKLKQLTVVK